MLKSEIVRFFTMILVVALAFTGNICCIIYYFNNFSSLFTILTHNYILINTFSLMDKVNKTDIHAWIKWTNLIFQPHPVIIHICFLIQISVSNDSLFGIKLGKYNALEKLLPIMCWPWHYHIDLSQTVWKRIFYLTKQL